MSTINRQQSFRLCFAFVLKSSSYADETQRDSPPTAGEGECSGSESYDSCGKRAVQRLDQILCYIDFFNSACSNNVLCQHSWVDLISRGMKYDSSLIIWIRFSGSPLSRRRCTGIAERWLPCQNKQYTRSFLKLLFLYFAKRETKDSSLLTHARFISDKRWLISKRIFSPTKCTTTCQHADPKWPKTLSAVYYIIDVTRSQAYITLMRSSACQLLLLYHWKTTERATWC